MNRYGRDQRDHIRFRESDSYDDRLNEDDFETDGSFTHSSFKFDDKYYGRPKKDHRPRGRFRGINRFGEARIRHDSYQDDEFREDYDPTYEDEYGMKHPYEHGGRYNRWSDDVRSDSSRESHSGKGPKGYKRSEVRIHEEACEILTRDPDLDASDVNVEVKDRTIVLSGEVNSRRDKRLAEALVEDIAGIDDVFNRLRVRRSYYDQHVPGIHEEQL